MSPWWWTGLLGLALVAVPWTAGAAAPAGSAAVSGSSPQGAPLDATIDAARARNQALQRQVARMERQDAARQERLRQQDAEIASLQRRLRAARVPSPAASTGR